MIICDCCKKIDNKDKIHQIIIQRLTDKRDLPIKHLCESCEEKLEELLKSFMNNVSRNKITNDIKE